jgi:hypothetical protein
VKYVRIWADASGASHFEDVEVPSTKVELVEGVPPLDVSGVFPVSGLVMVEQEPGTPDWRAHVAPRRQWVMGTRGRVAIEVSDDERREFGPGTPILVEDTVGAGHVSTPLTDDFAFLMIPCAD